MKKLTNLGSYDVNDIFEFFQASADGDGNVSQSIFFRCFNKLLAKEGRISHETQTKTHQLLKELFELFDSDKNGVVDVQELATPALSVDESTSVHEVIDRLFTAFDTEQKGTVEFNELISGLSILCGGSSRDEKVLAAFKVYDTNGDGVISQEEMTHYLESV
eukprot:jgi/Phyca11/541720/estExt2_Genewise1Plus.C_PHYCAscaffold_70574